MNNLYRRPDWSVRLRSVIEAARERPFSWGKHDCCLFAGDAIEAMTGIDPAADFRGRYKTRIGAYRMLKKFAGGGIAEMADKVAQSLKLSITPPESAGRGDVVLAKIKIADDVEPNDCLGVVSLDGTKAVFTAPEGLTFLPLTSCTQAWRIA